MDARLKTPEDPRPLTREECIVETVLEIVGGATVIEDSIERQIGPHDIHEVLYHLREACLAKQRVRARQSTPAMRAIKQLSTALRRANQPNRIVMDVDHKGRRIGELLQLDFPQPHARSIRAAAVGCDRQLARMRISLSPISSSQRRIEATANSAVSLVIPTLTQPASAVTSYTP